MTLQISRYSNAEPTADQIEDKKNSLKQVVLNEEAVEKIQELEDQNINIEALFNNGRANPFE
jgi:predicted patatin/cPLA2 family phospholipase